MQVQIGHLSMSEKVANPTNNSVAKSAFPVKKGSTHALSYSFANDLKCFKGLSDSIHAEMPTSKVVKV